MFSWRGSHYVCSSEERRESVAQWNNLKNVGIVKMLETKVSAIYSYQVPLGCGLAQCAPVEPAGITSG
jgi:hypothetical protein